MTFNTAQVSKYDAAVNNDAFHCLMNISLPPYWLCYLPGELRETSDMEKENNTSTKSCTTQSFR